MLLRQLVIMSYDQLFCAGVTWHSVCSSRENMSSGPKYAGANWQTHAQLPFIHPNLQPRILGSREAAKDSARHETWPRKIGLNWSLQTRLRGRDYLRNLRTSQSDLVDVSVTPSHRLQNVVLRAVLARGYHSSSHSRRGHQWEGGKESGMGSQAYMCFRAFTELIE